jgi:23S rRNA (cytidine1920-2'-O)/16S rRNA (cytidine1409-2'-O)-methyltransferase
MTAQRRRLDQELVARGLVPSRQEAHVAIEEGRVLVKGAVADKPARQVAQGEPIIVLGGAPRFVSRGGHKLQAALEAFELKVADRWAVDAGSATGGFTDCLLQAGAAGVLSVDVGYGQLHERLRSDPRVVSLERQNVRELSRTRVDQEVGTDAVDLVVADLSFTSLRPLSSVLVDLAGPRGELVVLCKPQFEVGREIASKGKGVVRASEDRREALRGVVDSLAGAGAAIMGVVTSPLLGPAGNAEFLVYASLRADGSPDVDSMIDAAIGSAEELG